MAEKRTTPSGETGTAVPKARTADPESAAAPEETAAPKPPAKKAAKASAGKSAAKRSGAPAKAGNATGKRAAPRKKPAGNEPAGNEPAGREAPAATRPVAKAAAGVGQPATAAPSGTGPVPVLERSTRHGPAAPGAWVAAAWEARERPDQPLQGLAELAVAELGPRAAAWVGWLRETYPGAPDHGIARLAAYQAGRLGQVTAFVAATRAGVLLRLPAATWVAATLVLRTAAAYGHDPADPRRAAELLELMNHQPGGARRPAGRDRAGALAARLGLRVLVTRLGPRRGVGAAALRVLTTAVEHGDGIHRLAHRAARFYRPGSPSSMTASIESTSSRNSP